MVDGAEKRGYPGGDPIGYEISANPNKPYRYGATQIDAPEQLDDARARLRHFRQMFWQRRHDFAVSRCRVFDPRQSAVCLVVAALTGQPARRFRQYRPHRNSDHRWNSDKQRPAPDRIDEIDRTVYHLNVEQSLIYGLIMSSIGLCGTISAANDKHPAPTPMRYDKNADQGDGKKPNRKQYLHREGKAATALRPGEFIEIGGHQGNLAAEANALNETQHPQRIVARGRSAG